MYTPKFSEGDVAYGILRAEIRKITIAGVAVSPNATDPIHVTNTDSDGRGWDDNHLFRTPNDAVKSMVDKYFTKYPDEKPKYYEMGLEEDAVDNEANQHPAPETAAPETAAPETAAPETAAPETAAEENPEG